MRVFRRLNVEVRILPYRHCVKSSKHFIGVLVSHELI